MDEVYETVIMAVLCNRAGHYIFALWFLLSCFGPIANLKDHYFQPSLSVSLSVCVSLTGTSTFTDFDETWSQGPYCDLVWPRP